MQIGLGTVLDMDDYELINIAEEILRIVGESYP